MRTAGVNNVALQGDGANKNLLAAWPRAKQINESVRNVQLLT